MQFLTDIEIPSGAGITEGSVAGAKKLLAYSDPAGLISLLQPHLGFGGVKLWSSAHGSTPLSIGIGTPTATGTATPTSFAVTNAYTRQAKTEYLVGTASTTAVAGWRAGSHQCAIGASAEDVGGFEYICRFGPATGGSVSTNRLFVGLGTSVAAPSDVEPSSISNIVGVGWDAADANIQIMHRGASAVTKVDTGIAVPTSAGRDRVFELQLYSPPGTTQVVYWKLTDITNDVSASGTISTNMPSTSTLLAPRGWMSVGGTSSGVGIALMDMYMLAR